MNNTTAQLARAGERAMTRKQILLQALRKEMTWVQAAEVLRLTPRQVRRIRKRYETHGEAGLMDLRLGKSNPRRLSNEWRAKILTLYRERYFDFSALHFFEQIKSVHRMEPASYTTIKALLQTEGLMPRCARHTHHRKRRERRPMKGMLLHLDGSTHAWLGQEHPNFDLLAVLDDATSEVYSAMFVAQEGTQTCMQVLRETIEKKGIFCSLYTDRAMHFVVTTKAGEKPDRSRSTQLGRALDRLGIELITAYSPQARGRGERLWRTWQGRLPQELRVAGITTVEGANQYLREIFMPWHNQSLTVQAAEPTQSAFVTISPSTPLDQIFSIHISRYVNADNTVQYMNRFLQIPPQPGVRFSFAGIKVTVHRHLDQTISITYGHHTLGRYTPEGELMESQKQPKGEAA